MGIKPISLNLHENVSKILTKEQNTNEKLDIVLYSLLERLETQPDTVVADMFKQSLKPFSHITSVKDGYDELNSNIKKATKEKIHVEKLLTEMCAPGNSSAYMYPVIGNVVESWMENPSHSGASVAVRLLSTYTYDPYVNEILKTIQTTYKPNTPTLGRIDESAGVSTPSVISPVLVINEKLSVFNVGGNFYAKKGKNIEKMNKAQVSKIDEQFVNACMLINSDICVINESEIKLNHRGGVATIDTNTKDIVLDGKKLNVYQRLKLHESAKLMEPIKSDLFECMNLIHKHIDCMANIDFVRRIEVLNEGVADVFRVAPGMYNLNITNNFGSQSYFKNVTPLQIQNAVLERLGYDVSKITMFKNLRNKNERTLQEIASSKRKYHEYIDELQTKLHEFEQHNTPESAEAYKLIKAELNEIKKEFSEYNRRVEQIINLNEDLTITIGDSENNSTHSVVIPNVSTTTSGGNNDTEEADSEDDDVLDTNKDGQSSDDTQDDLDFGGVDVEAPSTQEAPKQTPQKESLSLDAPLYDEAKESSKKTKVLFKPTNKSKKCVGGKCDDKKAIKESANLFDTVTTSHGKGQVVGSFGEDAIINVKGATVVVKQSKLKSRNDVLNAFKHKFDDKTLKLLESKMVKCGVAVNGTLIKRDNCFVKYSDYNKTRKGSSVNIIVENVNQMIPRENVVLLEDINQTFDMSNYIEGVIIGINSAQLEQAVENVLIDAVGYCDPNTDEVMVVKGSNTPNVQVLTVPKATVRTLSV